MNSIYTPKVIISPLENSVVIAPDKTIVTITSGGMQGASGGLRVLSLITETQWAPDIDNYDQINFTALDSALELQNPIGTPQDAQKLLIRIVDNGISQTLTFDSGLGGYRPVGVALPPSTVAGLDLYFGCIYNAQAGYWDVIALVQQ